MAVIIFLGNKAFWILVVLAGALSTYEYFRTQKKSPCTLAVYIALMLCFVVFCSFDVSTRLMPALFCVAVVVFAYNLFVDKHYDITVSLLDFWGFFYIGVGLCVVLSMLSSARWLSFVGYCMAVSVLNDTMAYFAGRAFGKHKFCPVSPKKSVEGAVAGVLASVAVSVAFGLSVFQGSPIHHFVVLGVLAGFAGEIGDLCASMVKRKADVKDYGNLMPGHGGALDRIDNMLFTFPVVYFYFQAFLGLL